MVNNDKPTQVVASPANYYKPHTVHMPHTYSMMYKVIDSQRAPMAIGANRPIQIGFPTALTALSQLVACISNSNMYNHQ